MNMRMLRMIKSAVAAITVCAMLSSCLLMGACSREEPSPLEICRALDALFENADRGALFYSSDEKDGAELMDAKTVGRLYTGKYSAPACFERIAGSAVRLPLDESGFEIHVLCALNRSDTDEISELVSKRLEDMRSDELFLYAPSEYLENYRTAEVYIKGKYVFLLSTPDNGLCKKCIASLI